MTLLSAVGSTRLPKAGISMIHVAVSVRSRNPSVLLGSEELRVRPSKEARVENAGLHGRCTSLLPRKATRVGDHRRTEACTRVVDTCVVGVPWKESIVEWRCLVIGCLITRSRVAPRARVASMNAHMVSAHYYLVVFEQVLQVLTVSIFEYLTSTASKNS